MIRYKKSIDNIATLTLDMADRSVNIINHEVGKAFEPVIDYLKQEKAKGKLKGVIITSAKKTFLGGGDLHYLYKINSAEEIFGYVSTLNKVFRDLEMPDVPVVAAINGSVLGSGMELALACHYRIVLDNPKIKIGFPEVNLGLMPGSGGVIRLLWNLGIQKTYPLVTEGKYYTPKTALDKGLIDELVTSKSDLILRAKQWILENPKVAQVWDRPNGRIKKGTLRTLSNAKFVMLEIARQTQKTNNNYPAQQAIFNTLVEATDVSFDTAVRIGSRYFTQLLLGTTARNMTKAFWFDNNKVCAGLRRPKGFGRFRPRRVGVIGAGYMGRQIAWISALKEMDVILKDVSKSVAQLGKEKLEIHAANQIKSNKIIDRHKIEILERIKTTEDPAEFKTCDLIFEAVYENINVKGKVTREADKYLDKYALFASNTSTLSITDLSEKSQRPEHFIGMHFHLPVETCPLVEIIYGEKTSDETIARAFDFARKLNKTPIIVKDNAGFYVGRVYSTYLLEGILLSSEGQLAPAIEHAGLQSGMRKGPLAAADDFSLDRILNTIKNHYPTSSNRKPAFDVLERMIEAFNRRGKEKGAGFYEYNEHNDRVQLWENLAEHFPLADFQLSPQEMQERMLFVQALEAVRCLEEGIIGSVEEANIGSIHGWGFAPFKGGAIQYIHDYGVDDFIKRSKELQNLYGNRFAVPELLASLIK